MRFETKLIHAGELLPRPAGAVTLPIYQSSTFETGEQKETGYHDVRYMRLSNTPNHLVLGAKLAALEGTDAALVTASGMAAVSSVLLGLLATGDHLLLHNSVYGGTHTLVTQDLASLGIDCTLIDGAQPASWSRHLTPRTKLIFVETITNPLMQVLDLRAVAAFAAEHRLVSVIDNTLATPVLFRPAEHGFDVVLHSATKYLNGHTDIVAGVVAGRRDLVRRVKRKLDHLGGTLDAHACFLLHRGLKTLSLRVRHQSDSALQLATALASHRAVERVSYPGLRSHPEHARAAELFDSRFGGMLSFELRGGVAAAVQMIERLRLPVDAPSLGGPETLVTRPSTTSHAGLSPQERERAGIDDCLVRVSVGLESPLDLIEDFEHALS